jgi:SpoVK/Ycf46/Vps4 family AAA+-type ATPase
MRDKKDEEKVKENVKKLIRIKDLLKSENVSLEDIRKIENASLIMISTMEVSHS